MFLIFVEDWEKLRDCFGSDMFYTLGFAGSSPLHPSDHDAF